MKKLMTILVVFAICGAVMAADAPYGLEMGTQTTTETTHVAGEWVRTRYLTDEQRQYAGEQKTMNGHRYTWVAEHDSVVTTTTTVPKTYTYTNGEGTSGLTYTVTASQSEGMVRGYERQSGNVYFTTTTDVPSDKVLAVQFLGAEIEFGDSRGYGYDANYKIKDYGIYLYNPTTGEVGEYLSVKEYNNYFGENVGLTAGTNFGVYYVDNRGNLVASTGDGQIQQGYGDNATMVNATNGIVGNFDDDSHELKVYDAVTHEQTTKVTDKHFLCLSAGEFGSDYRFTHWEFMLQTTLDDPYFPVNPNDFNDDVHIDDPVVNGDMTGQPLPGTLATILISSLCAGALRKKNSKKH